HSQLLQLFQNLLGNALKFRGPRDPVVKISATRETSTWRFSVSDNGIGIEPQHHTSIFDIFRRLHTREQYPGNGIGLAICKRVVPRHGGEIWVNSDYGRGSDFQFRLPDKPEGNVKNSTERSARRKLE